jgi:ribose 5-phosphate isomerase A
VKMQREGWNKMLVMQSVNNAKVMAAKKGLEFVEAGMVVGLGSGSTATEFIRLLGEQVQAGLKIRGIASSRASENLAISLGISIIDFETCSEIDVAIDGADEVGPGLGLIKGGGGALLREKIVASASRRFLIVADASKVVRRLGRFPLPVEVIQMAAPLVARKLAELEMRPAMRRRNDGSAYVTDEGNYILDCACGEMDDPAAVAAAIRGIVGVVEHGLFLGMAERALIADGAEVRELVR